MSGEAISQRAYAPLGTSGALCVTHSDHLKLEAARLRCAHIVVEALQSLRFVVFSLRLELPRCGRNVSDARRCSLVRDGTRMVSQVRSDLCQRLAPQIPSAGDRWHLDELFLKINGRVHYFWRAVDQDGDVLDIMVQSKRDKKAAKKFFRKLLKHLRYVPRAVITDKLKSYSAAKVKCYR